MNKRLLSFFAILLIFIQVAASPIDQATARKVGAGFAQNALSITARAEEMVLVKTTDAYFVFNIGNNGFVIVSADDCFRPIVGYSNEGMFPTENPSPEMMYYLDDLGQRRQAALRASIQRDSEVAEEWQSLLQGNPMPSRNEKAAFYLVKTKWNQGSPYNKFCPKAEGQGRAYAGCVATAMSQVMNYWRYPTHGFGSHSYTHHPYNNPNAVSYGELSANFAEATYDFDLMPLSISDQSPVENIDAIALFMYHCGIAVDMMYGSDGSGAYSYDVPEAVLRYFDYTNCCRLVNRNDFELGEFQALLKDQFDRSWPCYYSGMDEDGSSGHAFVCDGYDENDLFHFNWGWSGSGDGFFAIDELNVSGYAFNKDQQVVLNYVPSEVFPNTASAPAAFTAVPNGDFDLSVSLSWVNPSISLAGTALEGIDQIVITRDNKVIHTIDHPAVGEAMTYIDYSGLPISVDYSVYAICQGVIGRRAYVNGVNLGPACLWTFNLSSNDEEGWSEGAITVENSSGVVVAELTATKAETSTQVEIPEGWLTLRWTAPADTVEIGIEILNAENRPVFAFSGWSYLMPQGTFFKTVNTCGGEGSLLNPSNLRVEVVDNDVNLRWEGVPNPGYGYIIYRDGFLYEMVPDTTGFTDVDAAQQAHSYYVTAFCFEGETDPTNTVCPLLNDELAPHNLEAVLLENGKVKLTWEKPASEGSCLGYLLYRKALGEDYRLLNVLSANKTQYTDNFKVDKGNDYYYKITAIISNDLDESSPANALRHPERLYVMVNLTHIPSGLVIEEQENELLLQWDAATLAETYNVYRNGELIAEGIAETQFSCVADGEPAYYQVSGVLNGVESNRSFKAYYANYAIDETDSMDLALYPNPTSGKTLVEAQGIHGVLVYNLTGQMILSCPATSDQIVLDLSGQKPGVYFVRICTDHGELVKKLVLMQSF